MFGVSGVWQSHIDRLENENAKLRVVADAAAQLNEYIKRLEFVMETAERVTYYGDDKDMSILLAYIREARQYKKENNIG